MYEAVGRYGLHGDYGEKPQRFKLFSEQCFTSYQITAALNYI